MIVLIQKRHLSICIGLKKKTYFNFYLFISLFVGLI